MLQNTTTWMARMTKPMNGVGASEPAAIPRPAPMNPTAVALPAGRADILMYDESAFTIE